MTKEQIATLVNGPPGAVKRRPLTQEDYVAGVLSNDRTILGRTITLLESNAPKDYDLARQVLQALLPKTGNSIRVGITGVPGVGKSTFIEALGCFLIDAGHRVAVLAVDPSSTITRGSILGDKTRMEKLAARPQCFIRPSPSGGTLGGVTRKTRETIRVCEAAGYDVILVETIGVGQNEGAVRAMVDFFLLMLLPGGGDELQAIKRGVMEIADAVAVNKADGPNKEKAELGREEYARALHYLPPATRGWQTGAYTCSAATGAGVPETWAMIEDFARLTRASAVFAERRNRQQVDWVFTMIEDHLKESFFEDPQVKAEIPAITQQVMKDEILPTFAAERLLELYYSTRERSGGK